MQTNYWLKTLQKRIIPFFHPESFFLKTSFYSALKWFLLIFFALAVSNVFSSQKKKVWTTKKALFCEQNQTAFYRFLFFIGTFFMFILKKHLAQYLERLGYQFAAVFVTFVCITYFASQICIILPGARSLPHEKKKLTKFVYFLKTTIHECSIFWINMVRINLAVNSVLFWLEVMPGTLC